MTTVTGWTVLGVASSLALLGSMLTSRWSSDIRFWPPGDMDWRWWSYIVLSGSATISFVGVALLEERSFLFAGTGWWSVGLVATLVGAGGFLAATFDLGLEESGGMEGELRTDGYYRYSRNPQIVFLLMTTAGAVVLANSPSTAIVGAAVAAWFISMPFAEEPWLRDRFGKDYEEYCEHVPRFVSRTTIVRLVGIGKD